MSGLSPPVSPTKDLSPWHDHSPDKLLTQQPPPLAQRHPALQGAASAPLLPQRSCAPSTVKPSSTKPRPAELPAPPRKAYIPLATPPFGATRRHQHWRATGRRQQPGLALPPPNDAEAPPGDGPIQPSAASCLGVVSEPVQSFTSTLLFNVDASRDSKALVDAISWHRCAATAALPRVPALPLRPTIHRRLRLPQATHLSPPRTQQASAAPVAWRHGPWRQRASHVLQRREEPRRRRRHRTGRSAAPCLAGRAPEPRQPSGGGARRG